MHNKAATLRAYYLKNAEYLRSYSRARHHANREGRSAYARQQRLAFPDECRVEAKVRYAALKAAGYYAARSRREQQLAKDHAISWRTYRSLRATQQLWMIRPFLPRWQEESYFEPP